MKLLLTLALAGGLLHAADPADLFTAIRQGNHARAARLAGNGAGVSAPNPSGITPLLQAVLTSDLKMVRLLIAKGANVKAPGDSGITPLHAAVFDAELTRVLLDAGADPNATTSSGHTPIFGALMRTGNDAVVQLLLRAGANVNTVRATGSRKVPPLRTALTSGNAATVRRLIAAGANVKLADPLPGSGLKSGCTECVRPLLEKGAKLTSQSVADAAAPGSLEMVKMLVEAGAPVNGQDSRGYTPLMRAALSYHQNPALIGYLLSKGADATPKNETGDTALSIARRYGDTPVVAMLREAGAPDAAGVTIPPPVENNTIEAAITRSVPLLQKIGPPVFKKRACVTCHNNTLPVQVAVMAQRRGFAIDEEIQSREIRQIASTHQARRQSLAIGTGISEIYGYTLLALDAAAYPPDAATDLAVHQLAFRQEPGGYWRVDDYRPPQEYSSVAATALAIRGLQAYAPPGRAKEMKDRVASARQWLMASRPHGAEEHAMRLLGLGWTKAPVTGAVGGLVSARNNDGGWPQLPGMASDAYATGLALYALHVGGGIAVTDEVYQRGVRYLLDTQRPDGSWFVQSRSYPFQPYFESGFPYGHNQWISAAGSSWATMALLLTLPETR